MREINEALLKLELFYLDFFNNYLSVKKFAEFYGISEDKVLRMIDFDELITWQHEQFLIEESMKNENITDDDKYKSYVNPDGDFSADDIPF